jgi:malonyl-CoA/methylmalonyl-CoA synthetase
VNGNLYELLRNHFSAALDQDFLIPTGAGPITYRRIDEWSAQFARVLIDRGITPGERVVVQVPKSVEAVALYLACLRVGAVYVPLNTAYTTAEVQFFVDDARPALFVYSAATDVKAAAATAIANLSEEAALADPHPAVAIRLADDLAAMLYTSGTTGRSKGAMLTHANLASNALTLHKIWRFEPGDVLLHTLPIFHVHGLFVALHTAVLNASPVIFLERFGVDAVIDNLSLATVLMGVPTHYVRLLEDDRFDAEPCSTMRLFTSGSAPMTEPVHREFTSRTGHTILERYGMTEAGMITSNPYEGERVAGTVGFPLPGVEIRVCDDSGDECAVGETGTVETRGPNLFTGYWQLPDRTEAEHRDGGWFITGDVGSVDGEGRLTLEGRSSDMIISGGFNVYPRELELIIDDLSGVIESAVIGVPDGDLGEVPVAVVVIDEHAPTDEAAILDAVSAVAARFKVPRSVVVVEALPRNTMGKVQKAELRNQIGRNSAE